MIRRRTVDRDLGHILNRLRKAIESESILYARLPRRFPRIQDSLCDKLRTESVTGGDVSNTA